MNGGPASSALAAMLKQAEETAPTEDPVTKAHLATILFGFAWVLAQAKIWL